MSLRCERCDSKFHSTHHLERIGSVRQKARTEQNPSLADFTRDRSRGCRIIALRAAGLRFVTLSGGGNIVGSGARFAVAVFFSGCDESGIRTAVNTVPIHVSTCASSRVAT
jgi:hypothetical protein